MGIHYRHSSRLAQRNQTLFALIFVKRILETQSEQSLSKVSRFQKVEVFLEGEQL